uniref:hypothetical protein n=1 Tax=unclassified Phenylobacterium TaxID=2640670 RepID=UPI000AE08CF9
QIKPGLSLWLDEKRGSRQNLSEWPDEQKGANWHDLRLIAAAANVQCDVKQKGLYANWLTARDWDSNARFPGNKKPQQEVNDLITAVCHHQDGVMKWLDSLYHAL